MSLIHPGKILKNEYLVPLKMSARKLAQNLGVPTNRITSIINEKRSITADTALRLAAFFDTTPEFWLHMQLRYDLQLARNKMKEQ